jgi:phage terminase small subunit
MVDPDGLTLLERRVLEEYLIHNNYAEAYRRAGGKGKPANARILGQQILTRPNVERALNKARQARAERTGVTADRVIRELALIAFSDLADFAEWDTHALTFKPSGELDPDKRRVIKGVKRVEKSGKVNELTLEIVREEKLQALKLLGEHLGIFDKKQGSENDFKDWLEKLDRL